MSKAPLILSVLLPWTCLAQRPGMLPPPGGGIPSRPPIRQQPPPLQQPLLDAENLATNLDLPKLDVPRDPFWPVGYVSQQERAAIAAQQKAESAVEDVIAEEQADEPHAQAIQIANLSKEDQNIIRAQLQIDGFMRFGSKNVVTINGKILEEGDTVSAQLREQTYHFLIRGIEAEKVILEPTRAPADLSED